MPLDEEIYAELIADEKSTEEDITAEIDRAARLKADVLQRLAAIDEKLAVLQPGLSESQHMSGPPSSPYQNVVENGATSSSANSKTVRVKLPKLEVRKFSGKLEEWQEFWDSFESAIHANDSLSNVDKFSYLRGLLLEPARSAITGFASTSASYEATVELLKKRFGKKTAIQRTLVNELLNTRPVFNESDTSRPRGRELGWVLSGPIKRRYEFSEASVPEVSVNFISQDSAGLDKASLDREVSRLWDLESLGIKSSDEVHESFENEIEFLEGRYSVKLPWKLGHDPLPSNFANSVSRMKGQLKRLKREPEVLNEYDSIIKEQLSAGVIEKVSELEEPGGNVHYLPHHAVIRRDAETTKLRIVYDASSKETKNGTSLNDCLHTGPSLNPLLFDILVRFRENKIALVGDIEKAFLNVAVDPEDRDSLRFLWVEDVRDSNLSVVVYRFCRVVFGLNASPFLLNGTIRHHLATYSEVKAF